MRLSWQMNEKNKIGIYYNNKKREYTNAVNNFSHESLTTTYFFPFSDNLVQWSAPQTNRLLLEAGFWRHQETWGNRRADFDIVDPLAVGVTDNNPVTQVPGYVQLIQNYHGRVGATDTASHNPNYRGNFAMSYVTGAHAFKTGMDLNGAFRWADTSSVVPYSYVVSTLANNGVGAGIPVPTSLTLRSDGCTDPLVRQVNGSIVGGNTSIQPYCPTNAKNKVTSEGGVFVQDKWTVDRVTVSGGVRLDWFFSENPEFHLGPSLLTPNRNYTVPKFSTTRYKDWTPKVAVAYDLFGDGRTALKGNVGKYVLGQALVVGGLASQPGYNVQLTSSRSWVDNDRDFVPDCDLTRNTAQGPTAAGIDNQVDTCGLAVGPNQNFYSNTLIPNLAVQDDARYGWGKRPYSWEYSVSAAARAHAGPVDQRRRVLAPVRQLPGDRQHLRHGRRLRPVLGDARAHPRRAGVGGRRVAAERHLHAAVLQPEPWRGGQQPDGAVEDDVPRQQRLRQVVRLRHRPERPAAAGHHLPGRPQHRAPDDGLLRRPGSGQGGQQRPGRNADPRGSGLAGVVAVVPHGAELAAAGEVPRLLHDPEDRRAARRLVPEHSRHRVLGGLRGAQQRRVAAGGPGRPGSSAERRRHHRHHVAQPDSAGHDRTARGSTRSICGWARWCASRTARRS